MDNYGIKKHLKDILDKIKEKIRPFFPLFWGFIASIIFVVVIGLVLILLNLGNGNVYDCLKSLITGANRDTFGVKVLFVFRVFNVGMMIIIAVTASYVYIYILNYRCGVVFPKYLVLRLVKENNVDKVKLSAIIGNKNKHLLYNVKCYLDCVYIKTINYATDDCKYCDIKIDEDGLLEKNTIHCNIARKKTTSIDNFYRFSANIKKVPKKFIEDFLSKTQEACKIDAIKVTVSGKTNFLGGNFHKQKKYSLNDIIISSNDPVCEFMNIKKTITGKSKKVFDWSKFGEMSESGENDRKKIIGIIKKIIK